MSCDKSTLTRLKSLYYMMQAIERSVGGGEGVEGLYGSITRTGMHKVLDSLAMNCKLDCTSHLVDVGAGLGRPLLHALVHPGVASGFGYELDRVKCMKAAAFLKKTVMELALKKEFLMAQQLAIPAVHCSSIEKVRELEPATHAYSFWEGVPPEGKYAFGKLFRKCKTLQAVAVVQHAMKHPVKEMQEFGFGPLVLHDSFPVSMSGSGRKFRAYVFTKLDFKGETAEAALEPPTPGTSVRRVSARRSPQTPEEVAQREERPEPAAKAVCKEEEEEAVQPGTPANVQQRLLGPGKPMSVRPKGTPQSSGVSGRARRVLLQSPKKKKKGK